MSSESNPYADQKIARNEPCPCGSGKKYKRCHGRDSEGVKVAPNQANQPQMPAGAPQGFDPSQMDPAKMAQLTQAMQRLPRGQLQKIQGLVQKAMAGKDVSKEAEMLERMLPGGFKDLMESFTPPTDQQSPPPPVSEPEPPQGEMSVEEAKRLVAEAASKGEISEEQAKNLLKETQDAKAPKESKIGKFWKGLTGKK